MQPVEVTTLPSETLAAIAERHGLPIHGATRLPPVGSGGTIYLLGDRFVLKVAHDTPAGRASVHREAIIAPLARMVGVRTPALIAVDVTCEASLTPYLIYERIHGNTLQLLGLAPEASRAVWRELGRDLAALHTLVGADGPAARLTRFSDPLADDPRPWPEELASRGYFTAAEAAWLAEWLDRLLPAVLAPIPRRCCHGDVNAGNVIVAPRSRRYRAVIDWGGAGWGDPAWDFSGVALRVVPQLLAGYREVARLDNDETAESRILWFHAQLALFGLRRQNAESRDSDRTARQLLDSMRFFLTLPGVG